MQPNAGQNLPKVRGGLSVMPHVERCTTAPATASCAAQRAFHGCTSSFTRWSKWAYICPASAPRACTTSSPTSRARRRFDMHSASYPTCASAVRRRRPRSKRRLPSRRDTGARRCAQRYAQPVRRRRGRARGLGGVKIKLIFQSII